MRITNQPQIYKQNKLRQSKYQANYVSPDKFEYTNNPSQPTFGALKLPSVSKIVEKLIPSRRFARKTYIFDSSRDESLYLQMARKTDLGQEPICCIGQDDSFGFMDEYWAKKYGVQCEHKVKWGELARPMKETADEHSSILDGLGNFNNVHYALYYKDTGIWDDNFGQGYTLDFTKVRNSVLTYDKKAHLQPLIKTIRSGESKGRLVFADSLKDWLSSNSNFDEPIIVVAENFLGNMNLPKQLRGYILTKNSISNLEHRAAFMASSVDLMGALYDEKTLKALKKLNGKYVHIKLGENGLKFKQIKPEAVDTTKTPRTKIEIPQIQTSHKFLTTSEYTQNLVGPKAFNLKRLEDMKKQGKLQDVEIPPSFAIPCGAYDEVLAANPEKAAQLNELLLEAETLTHSIQVDWKLQEAYRLIKSMDIPEHLQAKLIRFKNELGFQNHIMIRSAFNGEDVKGYSAAGLYDSFRNDGKYYPYFDSIKSVMASKWNPRAYASRKALGIDHSEIKPTVIVQDYVDAEYKFTLYTKDPESVGKNKIQIEMHAPLKIGQVDEPYVIKYDTDTDEIKVEIIARKGRKITLDDKFRVIHAEPINDPIIKDLDKWKVLLKKLCRSALEVEKEFGAPQDIEGGIKLGENGAIDDAKLYLWQTRNQVF